MPLIRYMYNRTSHLVSSDYYGYINSDILISPSLFDALSICLANIHTGILDTNVLYSSYPFITSLKSQDVSMKLPHIVK